ncbi:PREDICTED: uncharacterized protein LOC104800580 [Tarenaya hassleriana]|uniref:uncharacterized protein LOC104800580 n=1 Tax=Tarenaya hassleriana TaxID=28532 RepID=UPI00053C2CF8|nr:PREDICTED: uncharacterized protein LOC104800580 [Tarenaya hassleriana]
MINTASNSCTAKMSWMKGKSSGWAAFDLKQRQKQGLGSGVEADPFPPVSNGLPPLDARGKPRKDHEPCVKSFSSVVTSPLDFPILTENKDCRNHASSGSCGSKSSTSIAPVNSHDSAIKKLKELYSWADDNLITDILLATNDNFEMALDFLGGIVSTGHSSQNSDITKAEELWSNVDSFSSDNGRFADEASINLPDGEGSTFMVKPSNSTKTTDVISDLDVVIQNLRSIPLEPEWEEDDLYLSHRKDALKMMRSASHHSRAAKNAFLRGDHSSAKYHSEKAREDWLAAERLNSEAAEKILSITNRSNDTWKLDLHGLHATEAIRVLQERLQKIESQVTVNRSVSPNRCRVKNGAVRSASQEPCSRLNMERRDVQRTSSRQLQNSLQVITGIGNHSHGHASLPIAVKRFVEDKGYKFDETRPGVITVRPKFRHSS